MKKITVMVLAVMLLGVMAAGAWATVFVTFRDPKIVDHHVGDDLLVMIQCVGISTATTYFYQVIEGELPPECKIESDGHNNAFIKGKLTREGSYHFTVKVEEKGYTTDSRFVREINDFGYGECTITVRYPDLSKDIPAPAPISQDTPVPDPSRDVPVPNSKPKAVGVIANKLGLSLADVEYVASSDMKAVQPPTASITNALSSDGREIISTQGSITAQKTGCYVFPLTVPADLVGTNTELKVYLADRSIFTGASLWLSALPAGITEAQIFTESGGAVTTLPGNILAAANLQANTATTFSTHITKALSQSNNNDNTDNNANTNNDNTDNNDNTNNDNTNDNDNADNNGTNDNSNTGVSSSSGGGGCESFMTISALILTALTAITKSKR